MKRQRGVLAASMALAVGMTMMRLCVWLEAFGRLASDYADEIG